MLTTQRGPLEPASEGAAVFHDVFGFRVNPDKYEDSEGTPFPGLTADKLHEKGGPYHLQMLVLQGACKLWKQLMAQRAPRHADAGGTVASPWEPVVAYAYIKYSDGIDHQPRHWDKDEDTNRMWRL